MFLFFGFRFLRICNQKTLNNLLDYIGNCFNISNCLFNVLKKSFENLLTKMFF